MIEVAYPVKALWPNGRAHYMEKSRATKKAKADAYHLAKAAKLVAPDGRVPVLLRFFPKQFGPVPDKDNCQASCKAVLDGIAMAMGVDDRLFDPRTEIASERLSCVRIYVGDEAL